MVFHGFLVGEAGGFGGTAVAAVVDDVGGADLILSPAIAFLYIPEWGDVPLGIHPCADGGGLQACRWRVLSVASRVLRQCLGFRGGGDELFPELESVGGMMPLVKPFAERRGLIGGDVQRGYTY